MAGLGAGGSASGGSGEGKGKGEGKTGSKGGKDKKGVDSRDAPRIRELLIRLKAEPLAGAEAGMGAAGSGAGGSS